MVVAGRERRGQAAAAVSGVSGDCTGPFGIFATASTNGYVTKSAAVRPITAARFAEMTWLREVVVVVVTEFGVGGIATWARKMLRLRRRCTSLLLFGNSSFTCIRRRHFRYCFVVNK